MQHLWTRFIAMLSQATHQAKMRAIYQLIGLDLVSYGNYIVHKLTKIQADCAFNGISATNEHN